MIFYHAEIGFLAHCAAVAAVNCKDAVVFTLRPQKQ